MTDGLIYAGSCFCPGFFTLSECIAHAKSKCAVVVEGMVDPEKTPVRLVITKMEPSLNPKEYVVFFEVYV